MLAVVPSCSTIRTALCYSVSIVCVPFSATGQSGISIDRLVFYIIMQSPLSSIDRDVANQTDLETRRRQNEFEVLTNVWNINASAWFLGVLAFDCFGLDRLDHSSDSFVTLTWLELFAFCGLSCGSCLCKQPWWSDCLITSTSRRYGL